LQHCNETKQKIHRELTMPTYNPGAPHLRAFLAVVCLWLALKNKILKKNQLKRFRPFDVYNNIYIKLSYFETLYIQIQMKISLLTHLIKKVLVCNLTFAAPVSLKRYIEEKQKKRLSSLSLLFLTQNK
jgi:hypothetical protein